MNNSSYKEMVDRKLEALERDMRCSICLCVFDNPHSLPCNHQFCYSCIIESFVASPTCPLCKFPFFKRSIQKNQTMCSITESYKELKETLVKVSLDSGFNFCTPPNSKTPLKSINSTPTPIPTKLSNHSKNNNNNNNNNNKVPTENNESNSIETRGNHRKGKNEKTEGKNNGGESSTTLTRKRSNGEMNGTVKSDDDKQENGDIHVNNSNSNSSSGSSNGLNNSNSNSNSNSKRSKQTHTPKTSTPAAIEPHSPPQTLNITPKSTKRQTHSSYKHPVLLGTSLETDKLRQMKSLAKQLGGQFVTEFSNDVTHLITSTNQESLTRRTIKYCFCVAKGLWILEFNWIAKCAEEGDWVYEEPYEVRGDTYSVGGPRYGRLSAEEGTNGIFHEKRVHVFGQTELPKEHELRLLLGLSGAEVLENLPQFSKKIPKKWLNMSQLIVVCDPNYIQESKDSGSEEYENLQEYVAAGLAIVVDCIWVMNSVSEFQTLSTSDYLLDILESASGNTT